MAAAGLLDLAKPMRDTEYYLSEGSMAVILVEQTLFKVHRSVLVKDNSSFGGMFSLDEVSSDSGELPEGDSDEHPIRLQGDTTDEFRALLWSLYALPAELTAAVTTEEDVLRFINLARITHKYQFASTEHWAIQTLLSYSRSPNAGTTHLLELTEVASLCENQELLADCLAKWKRLLGEGRDVALAIEIGEKLGMKRLTGLAYHAMMLLGRDHWESEHQLTRAQRIRLLSGHYELLREAEALPNQPPALTHDPMCTQPRRCGNAWAALWRVINTGFSGQVIKLQSADFPGRVMLAESVLRALVDGDMPREGMMDDMYESCCEHALKSTQRRVKEVQRDLSSYFSDVE